MARYAEIDLGPGALGNFVKVRERDGSVSRRKLLFLDGYGGGKNRGVTKEGLDAIDDIVQASLGSIGVVHEDDDGNLRILEFQHRATKASHPESPPTTWTVHIRTKADWPEFGDIPHQLAKLKAQTQHTIGDLLHESPNSPWIVALAKQGLMLQDSGSRSTMTHASCVRAQLAVDLMEERQSFAVKCPPAPEVVAAWKPGGYSKTQVTKTAQALAVWHQTVLVPLMTAQAQKGSNQRAITIKLGFLCSWRVLALWLLMYKENGGGGPLSTAMKAAITRISTHTFAAKANGKPETLASEFLATANYKAIKNKVRMLGRDQV